MTTDAVAPRSGRPRASSREVLAEAACELFLEQGYDATSIADITRRSGVSRSSFFNYFVSKADVLWGGFDERIAVFEGALAASSGDAVSRVRAAVATLGASITPDALLLALRNATPMGIESELERESATRQARIGYAVAGCLRRDGEDALRARVVGAAVGAAVLAGLQQWARTTPGGGALGPMLVRSLSYTGLGGGEQHPGTAARAQHA